MPPLWGFDIYPSRGHDGKFNLLNILIGDVITDID